LSTHPNHFLLPGLALTALIAAAAYALARLPGIGILGPLGLALVLGLLLGSTIPLQAGLRPGVNFAARTLLRVGIVLLGVRLNLALLVSAGPGVLLLDLLIVVAGVACIERLGKALGLTRGLRLAIAFGSSICGSSAIAAAAPVVGADEDEVSIAIGVASLYGLLGLLGYSIATALVAIPDQRFGLLAGATLYDVGQVLAAGSAHSPAALDTATLTKLTRVALLAPALLVVSAALALRPRGKALPGKRAALFPGFIAGFLLVGVASSAGLIPAALKAPAETASHLAMALAMAGIGLGVDLTAIRRVGVKAAALGGAGFALLVSIAVLYTYFLP
jgi:uncharacterized integral membrane protein (TIGR00698 family)